MSSLLGLDYSDDEEEGQTQTPAQTTTPATATPAPAAAPAIAGLAAYADDSDEEEATPVGALAHGAAAVAAVVPAVAPLPVPTSTAPLRPSASLHTIATPSSSLHAPTDRHAPASGVSRSSSVNDVAALSSAVAAASSPPPIAPELLALLPPLPSGPLAPALAARHELNLARQHAQSLNPRALPLVASLVANKSFHNPYILQRIADQLRIDQYGTNIDVRHWTEQNLDGRVEDDYIEIKRQAKEATDARLSSRSSIEFVPASSAPSVPAVAPGVAGPQLVSTRNADGSITRVRVFDAATSNPPPPTTTNNSNASASTGVADTAQRARKSKWGAPTASSAADEARKRQRL